MSKSSPLVSIVITIKNGMPYIDEAIESLRQQEFDDFEVVIQDCLSTDGSLEYIQKNDDLNKSVVSEKDMGIGDAWNKAIKRCRGQIVGSLDSDNLLKPNAIARVVSIFNERPDVAALYSGVDMISEEGTFLFEWMPGDFDFLDLVSAKLVPPWSTSFFNYSLCKDVLLFDSGLRTCVDFDIWLKLINHKVIHVHEYLGQTRVSNKSMSCRPESYVQFCHDKIYSLNRYLNNTFSPKITESLLRFGSAGIYSWAANALRGMKGSEFDIAYFEEKAIKCNRDAHLSFE